ncbi:hypothetical protein FSP39_017441 [Pinctada imbricata]|uniref:PPM-type phosphatase domain-containing protein n=1 Tax=Pinctada imbricata TaxID=66713 RepID=A0AA88XDK7_PINIB|nr:hypothetical protein FSP39_017441 [Pinctada imbricata]
MTTEQETMADDMSRSDPEDEDPTLEFQGQGIFRTETPETMLMDVPTNPDITIMCEKCQIYINLRNLPEHRLYHDALLILRYQGNNKPQSLDGLRKRRQILLRKLRTGKETTVQLKGIQRLNDAYELVKADLQGTFELERQNQSEINTDVEGISLNCAPPCVYAIGVCSSQNDRWKSYMEDTKVFQDNFGGDKNKSYFAIFDGYHGRFAADMAASELHHLLLNEMSKFDPKTKSTAATNQAEITDVSQYSFERPETRPGTKFSEREILYEGSVNIIQQIIDLCEEKFSELMSPRPPKTDRKEKEEDEGEEDNEETDNVKENKGPGEKKKNKIKTPMAIKMEEALIKAYYLLDILLSYGKDERSRVRWSGCSAFTMVIHSQDQDKMFAGDWKISPVAEEDEDLKSSVTTSTGKRKDDGKGDKSHLDVPTPGESSLGYEPPRDLGVIYVANAGNVHGVLVRANKAYKLSKDHTPNNKKEKNRVIKAGANISESSKEMMVNGVLATTRGLGNHGDVTLKKSILVEPHTITVPVDQYSQFVIIASNGVWEVFTEQEAASLLLKLLPCNFIPPPSKISTTLQPLLAETNTQANVTPNLPTPRRVSFSRDSLDAQNYRGMSPRTSTMISDKIKSSMSPGLGRLDEPAEEVQTDVSSNIEQDELNGDDSGNEADVETYGEYLSLPSNSRLSNYNPAMTRDQYHRQFSRTMAEHLVQAALLAGAKDNITAMVILLPGCGI